MSKRSRELVDQLKHMPSAERLPLLAQLTPGLLVELLVDTKLSMHEDLITNTRAALETLSKKLDTILNDVERRLVKLEKENK